MYTDKAVRVNSREVRVGVRDTGFLIYPICPICQMLKLCGNRVDESFGQ